MVTLETRFQDLHDSKFQQDDERSQRIIWGCLSDDKTMSQFYHFLVDKEELNFLFAYLELMYRLLIIENPAKSFQTVAPLSPPEFTDKFLRKDSPLSIAPKLKLSKLDLSKVEDIHLASIQNNLKIIIFSTVLPYFIYGSKRKRGRESSFPFPFCSFT